jgi:hypothetical protein
LLPDLLHNPFHIYFLLTQVPTVGEKNQVVDFCKIELGTIFGGEPETSREGEPKRVCWLASYRTKKKRAMCNTST